MALAPARKGFAQFRNMAALLSGFGYSLERIPLQTVHGRVDEEGVNSIRRSSGSKQYRISDYRSQKFRIFLSGY
jgi:hypothetical protein